MSGLRDGLAARTTGVKRVLSLTVVGGLAALILLVPEHAFGQGGPPLITDDPDTPGPGFWEINLATIVERSLLERRFEEPLADINYGLGRRIQLKFEIPWLRVREGGRTLGTGPGNAVYGVKWRFLGEEGKRVAWSTYPQLEVNSSNSMLEKDLVTEGPQLFLPTEFTFQVGHLELNGEIGRNFVHQHDDEWEYGLSTEIETHLGLELLGEVHGETMTDSPTELIVDVGGRQMITRHLRLLVAAGTAVHGSHEERARLRLYVGLQMNLPGRYRLSSFRTP